MDNFIDLYNEGVLTLREAEDHIIFWHDVDNNIEEQNELLGLTETQYSMWLADPDYLLELKDGGVIGKPIGD